MTISATTNRARWAGNGATTVFSFSFEIGSTSQIVLQYTDALGNTSTISPSAYSVSGIGSPNGGNITYPLSGPPIASGTSLTLTRIVSLQQLVDFANQANYFPDVVEGGLDYLMQAIQQLATQLAFAILAPLTDNSPALQLPSASVRAGKLLGFDVNGNVDVISPPSGPGNFVPEGPFVAGIDFTPNVTTQLTLSQTYAGVANIAVYFDGTYQGFDQYSLSTNHVVFTSPIPAGVSKVYIVGFPAL